jgi:antagonist of KipI
MSIGEVRVLEPGFLTTVQDARGRPGMGRFGIPPGGALDARSARVANRLVGNTSDEAILEITLQGPVLHWTTGAHIGLAGADLGAVADGIRLVPGTSYRLVAGSALAFDGPRSGARAYLAVEGGFVIDPVLGSRSTYVRSSFGGFEGRPLRAGDALRFAAPVSTLLRSVSGTPVEASGPIRFVPAPRALGWFGAEAVNAFCATDWAVASDSDRSGIRLTGGRLTSMTGRVASLGLPVGAIQVPPDGEPIVTMADGPVTGGYPVLGVIPRFEHGRMAQAPPGTTLRFRRISVAEVRRLAANVPPDVSVVVDEGDLAAGWAR